MASGTSSGSGKVSLEYICRLPCCLKGPRPIPKQQGKWHHVHNRAKGSNLTLDAPLDARCGYSLSEHFSKIQFYWWLVRVTLVVFYGFLSQHFERWWDLQMILLLLYECSLSSEDNQRWWGHTNPTCCFKNIFKLLALSGGRNTKARATSPHAWAEALMLAAFHSHLRSHLTSILVEFPIPYFCFFFNWFVKISN